MARGWMKPLGLPGIGGIALVPVALLGLVACGGPASHQATPAPTPAAAPSATGRVFVDPAAGAAPLVDFIAAARHTLDGEVYLASSKPVLAALEAAAARGVAVRIALEQHPYGTGSAVPNEVYRTLAAHGVQVRWTNPTFTYTHAKYLVADGQRAWIGTMNWTTSAFKGNREFGVDATDGTVARQAEAVFAADWAHRPFTGDASALVLSPVNARARIDALIASARHTLDIYAEEVADRDQEQAIIAAVRRGVRVRLVCTGDGDVAALRQAGVQVAIKKTPYIHAKAFVADGGAVFIGSENISATSLDKNREMGLILRDGAAIATVERTFAADIGGAPLPFAPTGGETPVPPAAATPGPASSGVQAGVQPNPTSYGTATTVQAVTAPGARCTVRVVYPSGSTSGSAALKAARTAGSDGKVSWTWKLGTHRAGPASATVNCTLGRTTTKGVAHFTVQR